MILSHRIQLDPTVAQARYFARAAGTARFVWNQALAEWNRLYAAGEKPKAATLKVAFNATKYQRWPWMKGIHRDAHSQPFTNLQRAFSAFFKKTAKHPTFKKRGKARDSFYVANDKMSVDGFSVRLPVIGGVRLTEALRYAGKVMSATVSRECDRWFIAIAVDVRVRDCRRRSVLSQFQDLLSLWECGREDAAVRPRVDMCRLRHGSRPRRERGPELGSQYRRLAGNPRLWRVAEVGHSSKEELQRQGLTCPHTVESRNR